MVKSCQPEDNVEGGQVFAPVNLLDPVISNFYIDRLISFARYTFVFYLYGYFFCTSLTLSTGRVNIMLSMGMTATIL